jgi:phosphoribosylformimino-5-aminoimidazole carboxamide ribotide isomerase
MRIIGVVDLLGGRAVQARAGDRHAYQPVTVVGAVPVPEGDAATIAHAYVTQLGIGELYVADLDAILGRAPHDGIVMTLATIGTRLWLDAGVSSIDRAERAIACGATRVVVGLETLGSFGALSGICRAVDGQRVAFSLDLKDGAPIAPFIPPEPPEALAARAVEAGVRSMLVIDLARVGTGRGVDLTMLARLRKAVPGVILIAGGGVRGVEDLRQLANAGCDGALVATALREGGLSVADIAAVVGV